jgi:hypothetical protein
MGLVGEHDEAITVAAPIADGAVMGNRASVSAGAIDGAIDAGEFLALTTPGMAC